jgi:hypothetical protein
VSWLVLERYCLGELAETERSGVQAHLDSCDACRSCRDEIEQPDALALPALPPLPVPKPSVSWLAGLRGWRAAWAGLATAAVAAAALVVFVVVDRSPSRRGAPDRIAMIKGGEVAIELVRESGGSTASDPSVFLPNDRFKVLFTCPPEENLYIDVLVHQSGEAAFPLRAQPLDCANRVAIRGAFRITGTTTALVCAVYGDAERPRDALGRTAPADLDDAVCVEVRPASGDD